MWIHDAAHAWVRQRTRGLFLLCVVLVIGLGGLLRTAQLTHVSSRGPDEQVYTHFAQVIADKGLGGYREIFANYAADRKQWLYPSPTRVTHVLLFASVMKLTGSKSAQAGAAVSWTLSILSIAVVFWIGRRFFNRWVGLLASLFLATYVADLEFARRAWGESTASFASLLLFGFACELSRRPRRWSCHVGFFGAGMACLLAKETSIFAYALCGIWLVGWLVLKARDAAAAVMVIVGGLTALGASFALLAAFAGDAQLALQGLTQPFGIGSNDWGAQYASGPWYQFLYLLWLLGPLTLVMAAIGAWFVVGASAAARGDLSQELAAGWLSSATLALLLCAGFLAASSFGPNLHYMRIMAPANPSYCLLASLGAAHLLAHAPMRLRGSLYPAALGLMAALFVVSSVRDYALYTDVVVRSGMQDLAARWIRDGVAHRGEPVIGSARRTLEPLASDTDLGRSVIHCQRGEFEQCVAAAQAAIRHEPESPEAWNNAAAGYAGLRRWDDAIRCAEAAVRLAPDFQLAKNNLAWALHEKGLASAAAP